MKHPVLLPFLKPGLRMRRQAIPDDVYFSWCSRGNLQLLLLMIYHRVLQRRTVSLCLFVLLGSPIRNNEGNVILFTNQQRFLVNVVSSIREPGTAVSSPVWCDVTRELVHKSWLTSLIPLAEPVTAWHKVHELPARICWHLIWKQFWKTMSSITYNRLKPSPESVSCKLWSTVPLAGGIIGCLLNAPSLSLSTPFIPCTLLRKTAKRSIRGMPWPLAGFCSHINQRDWGYLCELANHLCLTANILHICQQIHNDFSNLDLFLLFSISVLLWQKNSHPPTYPEIAKVDRRKEDNSSDKGINSRQKCILRFGLAFSCHI